MAGCCGQLSEAMAAKVDAEVRVFIDRNYERCKEQGTKKIKAKAPEVIVDAIDDGQV